MDPNAKYSRLRADQVKIFDCYCEILPNKPPTSDKPWIRRRFPDSFKTKEVLDCVPKFTFPCGSNNVEAVTYYSFVLTNNDSKWTFGFCRQKPGSDICLVILSHLPWHDTFYKILNHAAALYYDLSRGHELLSFLKTLHQAIVPEPPCYSLVLSYTTQEQQTKTLTYDLPNPDTLPTIPEDKNLTEYCNAVDLDNRIKIFASVLNERHIIVTSRRLDRLSSCVQAINSLIYPMHWQHIFIPILPSDLLAYLQAPMPFMIGVPSSILKKIKKDELAEAVILDADDNTVTSVFQDAKNFPPSVVSSIKSDLKNTLSFGETTSRAFLRALVILVGGYREALEFNDGQKITFNHDRFINTRPPIFQPFLRKMLDLQMFRQFVDGRLEMLNSGKGFNDDFEFEVNLYEERIAKKVDLQYQYWLEQMKTKSGILFKSINPSLRLVCKGIKEKSKQAYKDWKSKIESSSSSSKSSQATRFLYSRMD